MAQLPSGAWCKCGSVTPAHLTQVASLWQEKCQAVGTGWSMGFQLPSGSGHSYAQLCQVLGTVVAQWGVGQVCLGNSGTLGTSGQPWAGFVQCHQSTHRMSILYKVFLEKYRSAVHWERVAAPKVGSGSEVLPRRNSSSHSHLIQGVPCKVPQCGSLGASCCPEGWFI